MRQNHSKLTDMSSNSRDRIDAAFAHFAQLAIPDGPMLPSEIDALTLDEIPDPDSNDPPDVFALTGLALFYAQAVEGNLLTQLTVMGVAGDLTEDKMATVSASLVRETLGQLMKKLRARLSRIPDRYDTMLKRALDVRNEVAHGFFLKHKENYCTEEGRRVMIAELREKALTLMKLNLYLLHITAMLVAQRQ